MSSPSKEVDDASVKLFQYPAALFNYHDHFSKTCWSGKEEEPFLKSIPAD